MQQHRLARKLFISSNSNNKWSKLHKNTLKLKSWVSNSRNGANWEACVCSTNQLHNPTSAVFLCYCTAIYNQYWTETAGVQLEPSDLLQRLDNKRTASRWIRPPGVCVSNGNLSSFLQLKRMHPLWWHWHLWDQTAQAFELVRKICSHASIDFCCLWCQCSDFF